MPRTPLKLLQNNSSKDDKSDRDSSAESNTSHRRSRLLDLITENTTSDTNIDGHSDGNYTDLSVRRNSSESGDESSDNERTSFLHNTFKRFYLENREPAETIQMVPLCRRPHRTESHSRKPEADLLT